MMISANYLQAGVGIDLDRADLGSADLTDANLAGAYLSDADLSGAVLSGAEGGTDEQVEQAESLKGATMPNGRKYEDWLRGK